MNKGYPPMKKMIKIQTILLALLVSVPFVAFGQDNKPATGVMKEKNALQASETLQAADAAVQEGQNVQTEKKVQLVEKLHNALEKTNESKESSSNILKWMNDKSGDLVINILAGIITPIILYFIGFFTYVSRSFSINRNKLFCKGDFAQQIQKAKENKQDVSLKENVNKKEERDKEKLKNTYIKVQDYEDYKNGYQNARSNLWDSDGLKSGIFIVYGKMFTGRQFFLEKELVDDHKADVFEVNEKQWLVKKHDEGKKEVNEIFLKRINMLCRKWEIPVGGYTHKAVILLGESLTNLELEDVVKSITESFQKMNGLFNSFIPQKLTLIIKTNIQFIDKLTCDKTFPLEKLEFKQLSKKNVYDIFDSPLWDKRIHDKIKTELEKSSFYFRSSTSESNSDSALKIALWINTFGQPKGVKTLYQRESAKSTTVRLKL